MWWLAQSVVCGVRNESKKSYEQAAKLPKAKKKNRKHNNENRLIVLLCSYGKPAPSQISGSPGSL